MRNMMTGMWAGRAEFHSLAVNASRGELRGAIISGAVHRLRPKLMTEGIAIVVLMPVLCPARLRERGSKKLMALPLNRDACFSKKSNSADAKDVACVE